MIQRYANKATRVAQRGMFISMSRGPIGEVRSERRGETGRDEARASMGRRGEDKIGS